MIPIFGDTSRTLVLPGALLSPLTLTRSQPSANATAVGVDNVTLDFYAQDVPRYQGSARRLLLEGARTNLFLNSAVGATQNVTVTAVAHTLSMYGTGSITLSGASTAGPLNGTGANNRVSLTFTPSAGTLTLTVTGTCTRVQLEVGAFASSYMETAGASFARGADVATASLTSLGIPASGACTVLGTSMIAQNPAAGTTSSIVIIDDATNNNRFILRAISPATLVINRVKGGVAVGDTSVGTFALGTLFRWGVAIGADGRMAASINGNAAVTIAADALSNLSVFRLGLDRNVLNAPFGEFGLCRVLPYTAGDAALPAFVSALP